MELTTGGNGRINDPTGQIRVSDELCDWIINRQSKGKDVVVVGPDYLNGLSNDFRNRGRIGTSALFSKEVTMRKRCFFAVPMGR